MWHGFLRFPAYFDWPDFWNQSGTRKLALVALVLFGLPLLLTLQKLAAEPAMDEAHHQLHRF